MEITSSTMICPETIRALPCVPAPALSRTMSHTIPYWYSSRGMSPLFSPSCFQDSFETKRVRNEKWAWSLIKESPRGKSFETLLDHWETSKSTRGRVFQWESWPQNLDIVPRSWSKEGHYGDKDRLPVMTTDDAPERCKRHRRATVDDFLQHGRDWWGTVANGA